ncbi:proline dehydrogenase [Halobacteriales archaeon SW_7_68_16]|nr:MAG: proline dehydrogenase [Halobacteriales archaeon SW_7_68_16]
MIPPVARRFVAGETAAEAVRHVEEIGEMGVGAVVNLLGEHYADPDDAAADRDAYLALIDDLPPSMASISVKPTQIGLDVDKATFRANLNEIVAVARDRDRFVWIDMEGRTTTDATIDAYEDLAGEYGGGVGLCLQANLKRTPEDIERLSSVPGKLRLVKGAYDEPPAVAHRTNAAVDEAYRESLAQAFEHAEATVGVGSHDPAMIEHARRLADEFDREYEVQMLMGVRTEAQYSLAASLPRATVWQYVPYGPRWKSYFYRRVAERKENLLFAARAVAGI